MGIQQLLLLNDVGVAIVVLVAAAAVGIAANCYLI